MKIIFFLNVIQFLSALFRFYSMGCNIFLETWKIQDGQFFLRHSTFTLETWKMQRGDAGRRSFLVYLGTEGKGTFSSRLCSIWITEWPIIPPRRKWLTSSPRLKKKGDLTGSFARLKSESNWKVTFPWGWLKNCLWEHSWMGGGARRGFSGVKRICAFMGWEEHSSKKKKTLLSY